MPIFHASEIVNYFFWVLKDANLAVLYYGQGEYQKAYDLMQKAIGIREKVLPSEHPHLVGSKKGLEIILSRIGTNWR